MSEGLTFSGLILWNRSPGVFLFPLLPDWPCSDGGETEGLGVSATTAVVEAEPSASTFRFFVARCCSSSSDSELDSLELDSFFASFIFASSPSDSDELEELDEESEELAPFFFLGDLTSAFFSSSLSLSELESDELEELELESELDELSELPESDSFLTAALVGDFLLLGFSSSPLEDSELGDSEESVRLESRSAFLVGVGDFFFTSFFFLLFDDELEESLDSLSITLAMSNPVVKIVLIKRTGFRA